MSLVERIILRNLILFIAFTELLICVKVVSLVPLLRFLLHWVFGKYIVDCRFPTKFAHWIEYRMWQLFSKNCIAISQMRCSFKILAVICLRIFFFLMFLRKTKKQIMWLLIRLHLSLGALYRCLLYVLLFLEDWWHLTTIESCKLG